MHAQAPAAIQDLGEGKRHHDLARRVGYLIEVPPWVYSVEKEQGPKLTRPFKSGDKRLLDAVEVSAILIVSDAHSLQILQVEMVSGH
jgi:hypothetical protein